MKNLPALLPSRDDLAIMKHIGGQALASGFLPRSIDTPEKALTIILKARELNVPPMQAFGSINVINGKPAISSELMLALILRDFPATKIVYEEMTENACTIVVTRPGMDASKFSFTMEDAKRAELLKNPSWHKYPKDMLKARCISQMARSIFPDALMGCSYTPEELGAEVDQDGTIIELDKDSYTNVEKPKVEAPTATTTNSNSRDSVSLHPEGPRPAPTQPAKPQGQTGAKLISDAQAKRLYAISKKHGWSTEELKSYLQKNYNISSTKDISWPHYETICKYVENNKPSALTVVEVEEPPIKGDEKQFFDSIDYPN